MQGFPIRCKVTHLTGQLRFAFATFRVPPYSFLQTPPLPATPLPLGCLPAGWVTGLLSVHRLNKHAGRTASGPANEFAGPLQSRLKPPMCRTLLQGYFHEAFTASTSSSVRFLTSSGDTFTLATPEACAASATLAATAGATLGSKGPGMM
jgi:hypothetical protein